ncbi:adenosinetriphosphatase [Plasmodium inui San Antonio 1]|uniref:DNA 3'-5' helicase n=1 Tax=Plasmodium inui San Antonio 1 TaxID=1237626 RepID=W7A9U5_9APIC|nr:adenosinetriphosphatase [Plasmodium inui San Antonio 1]EUD68008.1 adenosinetriphosphatase [Plasmodium inui San Antonio 1]
MAEGEVSGSPPRDLLNRYRSKYRQIDLDKAKTILQKHFGISEFKEKQVECLNAIKNFQHVLNIMPTGGGKSLIYQVTPLLVEGISIVISPLISLMYDQTKSLNRKNIVAETINSSLKKKENEKVFSLLKNYNNCDIKVLYVTPETATSDYFLTVLKELYLNEKIALISIDEVHCISTWGCDFRKSYRNLNKVLKACPYVRVYTCTATATKSVERDIIVNLNLEGSCGEEEREQQRGKGNEKENQKGQTNYQTSEQTDQTDQTNDRTDHTNGLASDNPIDIPNDTQSNAPLSCDPEGGTLNSLRIVRTSFNRPNLKYVIVYSDLIQTKKKESIFHIIQEKRNLDKIGIIYCFKRNTCDEISMYLREQGFQALSYHAGLSNSARKRIQEKWVNGNAKILVATIAFGMGIDRKDVSFIIHFNLPKSIENYYQESGRSGRNGNISFCYLYYSKEDVEKLSFIIRSSYANLDMQDLTIQKKYEKEIYNLECVHNLCVQEKCIRSQILAHFGELPPPRGGSGGSSGSGSGSGNGDDDYCCSYCSDVKGSRHKIERVIQMHQEANWNIQSNYNRSSDNQVKSFTSVLHTKKHKLSDYSDSDKERGLDEYKITERKIKGFVPFQSASSIISKEIRAKGIIEVMKELERREELMEQNKLERHKLQEERSPKMEKMTHSISYFTNVQRKPVFSSFKVPRKL